jgi:hypothetical protein
MLADGTIAAAAPNEKPSTAYRLAPWATATTTLTPRMWFGISPNANTTGPTNDPWGTGASQPYAGGSTVWSKLVPNSCTRPSSGRKMGAIECEEAICIWWEIDSSARICYAIFGKIIRNGANTEAKWALAVDTAQGDTTAPANGNSWSSSRNRWLGAVGAVTPFGNGFVQHSAGTAIRPPCIAQDSNGTLYGWGRTDDAVVGDANAGRDRTYSNATEVFFPEILVSGGVYTAGTTDDTLGILRQIRYGPIARRGQATYDSAPAVKAICLNYDDTTAIRGGLWFTQF